MGQMEQQHSGYHFTHNSEAIQMARNMTQIELAEMLGQDLGSWIGEHANDFNTIVSMHPEILDELAEEQTHKAAIEKITKEIYH